MSSRNRARKEQQQRLTFEPVATAGSGSSPLPGLGLSPARARFSSPTKAQQGTPSRRPTVKPSPLAMPGRNRKPRQQTLESALGKEIVKETPKKPVLEEQDDDSDDLPLVPSSSVARSKVKERRRPSPLPPRPSIPRSSMFGSHTPSRRVVILDSEPETPVEEDGGVTDSDGEGPLKHEIPRSRRQGRSAVPAPTVIVISGDEEDDPGDEESENEVQRNVQSQSLPDQVDDDDDEDDLPTRTPRSSMRARMVVDDDPDAEDDEEGNVQSPAKRRRLTQHKATPAASESDKEGLFGTPRRRTGKGKAEATPTNCKSLPPASSARIMRSGAPRHRSAREKKMELLRRHRAGEKYLTIEDLDTSTDEDKDGLYDTDDDLQVLEVFDDDEESENEQTAPVSNKAQKQAQKKILRKASRKGREREGSVLDQGANSEDENFIDDDDDTLGVSDEALHLMPLEFTRSAIKPLRAHFKDAIAWLIHRRIDPGFDKDSDVYVRAWRKLSDEVTGLANSKYISSVWKPNFHKALKARPYLEQKVLGSSSVTELGMESCQACGRSGHPATWLIRPVGKPYDPKTLDEVESDSEDEDENEDEEEVDRDFEGNPIPPETTEFYVGKTCNSNAETAHRLMHWKAALRDWVDGALEGEGLFAPAEVLARAQLRPRARHRLAAGIVARWDAEGVVQGLYIDFEHNIERARNRDPVAAARGGRH